MKVVERDCEVTMAEGLNKAPFDENEPFIASNAIENQADFKKMM